MKQCGVLVAGLFLAFAAKGQYKAEPPGFYKGNWALRPTVGAIGAYDSRVLIDDDGAVGDAYGELGGAASLNNLGGQYDLSLNALYAYRFYSNYHELNDDRYNLGLKVGAQDEPLYWSAGTDLRKSLDYQSGVDISGGQSPGDVLSDDTKQTYSLDAGVGYAGRISDRTELTPSYQYRFFYEDSEVYDDFYWQIHDLALDFGYAYSDLTKGTLGASYTYQINEEEIGHIVQVLLGAASRSTDHTHWTAQVGLAAAKYESSGADQSVVGNIQGAWQTTEKVSTYLFGGNSFQPGYGGGGARMVYRLGYGANWNIRERWDADLQVLHSYDDPIGSSTGVYSDEVRNFFTASLNHNFSTHFLARLSYRYVQDEKDEDQQVVLLQLSKKY